MSSEGQGEVAQVRRIAHLCVIAALAVATALAPSAAYAPTASAASGPLAATWISVDTDGSNQTLDIKGSGVHVYSMFYFDDAATGVCGGDPARVTGPGYPDGDNLTMVGALTCLPGGNVLRSRLIIGFVYDGSADTLTDDFGVVWHRAN